ncbi:helix-turn-helix transcriptional regulator [Providencia rettgeri]|uniref:helix-turn-helix domain-containing protein n=1 Tax=Providencia rettgeri TaxID=587 RepID=UPI0032DA5F31
MKERINITIGEFLKESRKNKNMTGRELAKLMHVSQQQISRYETGQTKLTLEQLNMLLVLLGRSWSEVFHIIEDEYEKEWISRNLSVNNNLESSIKHL